MATDFPRPAPASLSPAEEATLRAVEHWAEISAAAVRSRLPLDQVTCSRGYDALTLAVLTLCGTALTDGCSQQELLTRLPTSPAHLSGLLERLRRQGLLDSHRAAQDRRRQQWQLTTQGQTLLKELCTHLTDISADISLAPARAA